MSYNYSEFLSLTFSKKYVTEDGVETDETKANKANLLKEADKLDGKEDGCIDLNNPVFSMLSGNDAAVQLADMLDGVDDGKLNLSSDAVKNLSLSEIFSKVFTKVEEMQKAELKAQPTGSAGTQPTTTVETPSTGNPTTGAGNSTSGGTQTQSQVTTSVDGAGTPSVVTVTAVTVPAFNPAASASELATTINSIDLTLNQTAYKELYTNQQVVTQNQNAIIGLQDNILNLDSVKNTLTEEQNTKLAGFKKDIDAKKGLISGKKTEVHNLTSLIASERESISQHNSTISALGGQKSTAQGIANNAMKTVEEDGKPVQKPDEGARAAARQEVARLEAEIAAERAAKAKDLEDIQVYKDNRLEARKVITELQKDLNDIIAERGKFITEITSKIADTDGKIAENTAKLEPAMITLGVSTQAVITCQNNCEGLQQARSQNVAALQTKRDEEAKAANDAYQKSIDENGDLSQEYTDHVNKTSNESNNNAPAEAPAAAEPVAEEPAVEESATDEAVADNGGTENKTVTIPGLIVESDGCMLNDKPLPLPGHYDADKGGFVLDATATIDGTLYEAGTIIKSK